MVDDKDKCKQCKGIKVVDDKKIMEVAIEPGVPNDHDYIFHGDSDEYPGILGGDLVVRVSIEAHKVFTRKGADLFIEKKITLLEALTGLNFDIMHLDGVALKVSTLPSEVISHDEIKVVKGKGMPFYKDSMSHGNLYVKFSV
jgi:DnaJ family protein A protein 2